MHDGVFQTIVMQDRRIDKGGQRRLGAHDLLGLLADFRPDRIDLADRTRRLCQMLRHDGYASAAHCCFTWANT